MIGCTFFIADVFAEDKFAGNQLAVFIDGSFLADGEMQGIAREMNYSETTFILSDQERDGGYDVRIFTPAAEMPFAGHPTLGTAYIIQQEIIRKKVEKVNLNLKVGQIPVTFSYINDKPDILWMKQNTPEFGEVWDRNEIAPLLGLDVEDIDDRFPIEEVSTGVYTSIVPLRTIDAVRRARISVGDFLHFVHDKRSKTVLIFCPETFHEENDLHARFFADYLGITEDPATGSANGCLAGYLVKHKYFGKSDIDIMVEQGYEIKRPSLLMLRAGLNGRLIDVHVGGRVQLMAKGELYL
ncbi:MAG: phenazine biosynthesis protein [candidate division Zixibacteria bacterium HGW-Zixibacteria-1]|nr:MAG: phenazine biosynthesis protein [candidate division Zixibacteria bacterium HGW-Zixibacteria-1]